MELAIVLIRLALTVIFGTAGITKLIDPRGTREAVKNFGVPDALAPAVSVVLPLVELSIAAGLLVNGTTPASVIGALLLLGLFLIAIAVNLAQGRKHDCHCFGQLHSKPLGWQTLARNAVFALAASFVLWRSLKAPLPSIPDTLSQLNIAQWLAIAAAVLVVVCAFVFLGRREKNKRTVETKLEGLPLNAIAPGFEMNAYDGGMVSLERLLSAGKPLLLIFTNPVCGPCVTLFGEIKEWQEQHRDQLTIAIISFGTIKENFVNVARNGLGQVLLQKRKGEVAEKYGATLTPTAVIVDTNGHIASKLAAGADEIRDLLANIVGPVPSSEENYDGADNVEVSRVLENV